jgi:hypothetical protein
MLLQILSTYIHVGNAGFAGAKIGDAELNNG